MLQSNVCSVKKVPSAVVIQLFAWYVFYGTDVNKVTLVLAVPSKKLSLKSWYLLEFMKYQLVFFLFRPIETDYRPIAALWDNWDLLKLAQLQQSNQVSIHEIWTVFSY